MTGVLIMILVPVLVRCIAVEAGAPAEYLRYASDCRIDSIGWGCLFAAMVHYRSPALVRLGGFGTVLLPAGALLVTVFTFGRMIGLKGAAHEILTYTGQGVGLILMFTYLYVSNVGGWLLRALEAPPLRFMGRISYGMYIWHFAAVYGITMLAGYNETTALPGWEKILLVFAAVLTAVGLAFLSFTYVLAPFSKFRRKFGSHVPDSGDLRGKAESKWSIGIGR